MSKDAPHGWIVEVDGTRRPMLPPNPHSKSRWLIEQHARAVMAGDYSGDALYWFFPGGIVSPHPEWPTREELIEDRMKLAGRLVRTQDADGKYVFHNEPRLTRAEAEQAIDEFYERCPEARSPRDLPAEQHPPAA